MSIKRYAKLLPVLTLASLMLPSAVTVAKADRFPYRLLPLMDSCLSEEPEVEITLKCKAIIRQATQTCDAKRGVLGSVSGKTFCRVPDASASKDQAALARFTPFSSAKMAKLRAAARQKN